MQLTNTLLCLQYIPFPARAFSNLDIEQDSNRIWVIIPVKMRLGCSLALRDSQIRRQSNLKQEKRAVSTQEEVKRNAAL